ncbi:hypothetical protein E4O82_10085, partial [Neisseria meningitidis]|nr:hypothetical protein [Neisseria meningitidis]
FACNSNADGQNQGRIGYRYRMRPIRMNLGLTQERRCDFTSRTVSTASHNARRNTSKRLFPHRSTRALV